MPGSIEVSSGIPDWHVPRWNLEDLAGSERVLYGQEWSTAEWFLGEEGELLRRFDGDVSACDRSRADDRELDGWDGDALDWIRTGTAGLTTTLGAAGFLVVSTEMVPLQIEDDPGQAEIGVVADAERITLLERLAARTFCRISQGSDCVWILAPDASAARNLAFGILHYRHVFESCEPMREVPEDMDDDDYELGIYAQWDDEEAGPPKPHVPD